jgi:DNA-binding transcriptional ArsR family regulator
MSSSSERRAEAARALRPPFAYPGLDRIIHERARLSVLTSLISARRGVLFVDLRQRCGLTDGNLNRHLHVLEQAGLVTSSKELQHGRAQTICRITAAGRRRYLDYLQVLERVLLDATAAVKVPPSARTRRLLGT